MRTPVYTKRFEKDMKRLIRRGSDTELIKAVMSDLIKGKVLDSRYRDHMLVGNFKDRRECHVSPDWILIYRIDEPRIIFERTGTHSDLFR